MKATPKTKEIIDLLHYAVNNIIWMEFNIKKIREAKVKADTLIDIYKTNWNYFSSCKITSENIYDEFWEICASPENLPQCATILSRMIKSVNIPYWICDPQSDYPKQVNDNILTLNSDGYINKSQASDLYCFFDLLSDWVVLWMFRFDDIFKQMGSNVSLHSIYCENKSQKNITDNQVSLPDELNTDSAKCILQKAIDAQLCTYTYKWLKSKALLAYFADKASESLMLGKGEYDGKVKISWKPFETLFNVSSLSMAKNDYQKTGTLPNGYQDIDILFQ